MPTNEAGLSGGQDQGDGGRTTASDTPGGERNTGVAGQGNPTADQTAGGRGGLSTPEMLTGQQQGVGGGNATAGSPNPAGDRSPAEGHLGSAGDPVEGKTDPAATGQGPAQGEGA